MAEARTGSIAPRSRSRSAAPTFSDSRRGRARPSRRGLPSPTGREPRGAAHWMTQALGTLDGRADARPDCEPPSNGPRRSRRADRAGHAARRARRRSRRGDGVRLPVRSRSAGCSRSASTSPTAGSTPRIYDTLASEARLASFVAIATGQIPHEHWFKLGRSLTPTGGRARAAVVERVDVRVLHAAARDARLPGHAARRDLPRGHRPADPVRRAARECRGASPSRPTTRRTSSGTTSTARSACPASV